MGQSLQSWLYFNVQKWLVRKKWNQWSSWIKIELFYLLYVYINKYSTYDIMLYNSIVNLITVKCVICSSSIKDVYFIFHSNVFRF